MSKRLSKNAEKYHSKNWTFGTIKLPKSKNGKRKGKGPNANMSDIDLRRLRRKLFIKTIHRFRLTKNTPEIKQDLYREFLKLSLQRQQMIANYKYERTKNPITVLRGLFEI